MIDGDKLDDVVLALLHLTSFTDRGITRAWKGQDWEIMNRLHAKGFIDDPRSKAKSVVLTETGIAKSRELFEKHFQRGV